MASRSSIEWTDSTWNPVTGCSKISEGCRHCYAERMAGRLKAMGSLRYRRGFQVTLHEDLIRKPLEWTRPRTIFVNSMSDLFHNEVPVWFIDAVFDTIRQCPHHVFQILTKRGQRLRDLSPSIQWPDNLWVGVSVENEDTVHRIRDLQEVPSAVRFLSCEPLLGPLPHLPLDGIHWVIVGGESGPEARPMEREWVEQIRRQCREHRVPFFFKQWGGVHKKTAGRLLRGRTYNEMPKAAHNDPAGLGFAHKRIPS